MPWSAEPDEARPVVLVEGDSDRRAVEVLALRLGVDLAQVQLVPMAGITNLPAHLARLAGSSRGVAVLYDVAEARYVDRVLEGRDGVARFGCADDLEHELLRALGQDAVEEVIEAQGELTSLRLLQRQPAQRDRSPMQHLRRFISSHSGRKLRYAGLLSEAVPLGATPAPLLALLAWIDGADRGQDRSGQRAAAAVAELRLDVVADAALPAEGPGGRGVVVDGATDAEGTLAVGEVGRRLLHGGHRLAGDVPRLEAEEAGVEGRETEDDHEAAARHPADGAEPGAVEGVDLIGEVDSSRDREHEPDAQQREAEHPEHDAGGG